MTNSDHANGAEPRLRRPLPPRTMPRRNILGVFMQKDGSAQNAPSQAAPKHSDPPARSHPLGLPVEEDGPQQECIAPDFDHAAMQAASSVADRHIREGAKYTISTDTTAWKRLSSLPGSIDPKEIADLARALTQGYTAVAQSWIDMADKLRSILGTQTQGKPVGTGAPTGPMICIQAQQRMSARVRMFGAGEIQTVHPLVPEDASQGTMITDVSYADGQIDIHIPSSVAPGRYHGVILSTEAAPIGVVTLTVPDPGDAAP